MRTETRAEGLRRLRAQAVADGKCQECRARPPKPGCVTCVVCLAARKDRINAYRFVGLCYCGAEPAAGLVQCDRCRSGASASAKRSRALKRERRECLWSGCHATALSGRSMCGAHLDEMRETARKNRSPQHVYRCRECGEPGHNASIHRRAA